MKTEYVFLKNHQISNFMKIRPVEAQFFLACRQTDMTKRTVCLDILRAHVKDVRD